MRNLLFSRCFYAFQISEISMPPLKYLCGHVCVHTHTISNKYGKAGKSV